MGLVFSVPNRLQAAEWYNDHYLGVSFGSSNYSSGVTSVSEDIDYQRQTTGAAAQYRKSFSKELALELAYMDFGELSLIGPEGQQFFYHDQTRVDFGPDAYLRITAKSVGLNGMFRAWLTKSFAAGVRIGYHFWTSELIQRDLLNAPDWSVNDRGADLYWSLGFQYALGSLELGLRAENVNFNGQILDRAERFLLSVDYGFRL